METIVKTSVDALSDISVSINTQSFIEIEGEQVLLKNHRKSYLNSQPGRAELESEQSGNVIKAVFAIWGDKPAVDEKND